jgi:cell surface protein SprA
MTRESTSRSGCALLLWAVASVFLFPPLLRGGSAALDSPRPPLSFLIPNNLDPRTPIADQRSHQGLCLTGFTPATAEGPLPWAQTRFILDSTATYVTLKEEKFDLPLRLPRVMTLAEYTTLRLEEEYWKNWRETVLRKMRPQEETRRRGPGGLTVDIPVEIKSKAFQTIFGGSTVGLNVTGDIRIFGNFRNEKRSQQRTLISRGTNNSFKLQQQQRFTVTGRIGEKVTVNVDQDSERAFEFDNAIKLKYEGDEDEIVQRIEAGNIALSLPATRFVTFSGRSAGLFGIKMQSTLGRLNLTTIASQEKGENKKLTLTGGATEGTTKIQAYEFRRNTYFFLDSEYRENYRYYTRDWIHVAAPNPVREIEVYKSAPGYQSLPENIKGWALYDLGPNTPREEPDRVIPGSIYQGRFIRMEPSEYFLNSDLGYIVLNTPLNDDEVLGVAYVLASGDTVGDFIFDREAERPIFLKLIKDRSPQPDHKTWNLEWKHVYFLGARNLNPEGFELKIFYKPASGPPEEFQVDDSGQERPYVTVLGLDRKNNTTGAPEPDFVFDEDNSIINWGRGELIFPYLRPFDADTIFIEGQPKVLELRSDQRVPAIYDTTKNASAYIASQNNFFIEVKSKSRSSNFNLGFNVIENSEQVVANGQPLKRGVDYVIDYFSGQLTITNETIPPDANIEISYESNQLFQLEKKTLMGTRAEYNLWGDSFIGGTFLYLNERTLDQKVRVGRGPMRNMVWDLNTSLKFEPKFLTRALDALPFIETEAPSTFNFEGEMAQVVPNPNTLNNPSTGDKSGVAYVDDFEGSKRETRLGVMRSTWTLASAPIRPYLRSAREKVEKMARIYWYNPFIPIPVKEIWPNRQVNRNFQNDRVNVLSIVMDPNTAMDRSDPQKVWGGVMRALSPGFFNQTDTKFLEVWVQGDRGRLHIDMGQISEDVIPNRELNTEDQEVTPGTGLRDGIVDPEEDSGLDGMFGPDPPRFEDDGVTPFGHRDAQVVIKDGLPYGEPYDFWDLNRDGFKQEWEPWSYDDWEWSRENYWIYNQVSGTEKNAQRDDQGGYRPDTEDINANGVLDFVDAYFEYSIDLNRASPDAKYIAGGQPALKNGWVLYRIPLTDFKLKQGSPDLAQIEYIRIWIDGLTDSTTISIAEINLVGNDWKELGVAPSLDGPYDANDDTTVAVSVINTDDNIEYSESIKAIGVSGPLDRISGVRGKEQSLVLKVNGLKPGYNGIARKTLFQPENFIYYNKIKMFVYGKDDRGLHITPNSSKIVFFIRFGSDDRNYYEVRQPVYPGWDRRNEIEIEVFQLTLLKTAAEAKLDSTVIDDSRGLVIKYLGDGREYRMKGNPSLTNVRQLVAGVENTDDPDKVFNAIPFTGEIWMNELRLADVRKDRGTALRARADLRLADFATVNAEVNRQDADFHNVQTRFGSGNNRFSNNLNAKFRLDKFLPSSWGITLPVNLNYSRTESTPKYLPGQDVEVRQGLPEEILERIRSRSERRGLSVSFSKKSKSKNFLVRQTLDRLTLSYNRSIQQSSNPTIRYANANSWSTNIGYNLTFGRKNFFQPFSFLQKLPLIGRLGKTKLYYTPQSFSLKATTSRSLQQSESRRATGSGRGVVSSTEKFTTVLSGRTNVKLFESLTLDLNRSHTRDLRGLGVSRIMEAPDLGITQSFSARYQPTIFNWLTNNFSYQANYRYNNNIVQGNTGRSAAVNTAISGQFSLKLSQLLRSVKKPDRRGRSSRRSRSTKRPPPGPRPTPGAQRVGEEEEEPDRLRPGQEKPRGKPGAEPTGRKGTAKKEQEEKKKESKGFRINILGGLASLLDKFQDITVNFSQRENVAFYGLEPGQPRFGYQFGWDSDPGISIVEGITRNQNSFSRSKQLSLSSGLDLTRNIGIRLRFSHDEQRNETTQITGNFSDSWLQLGDFDMPFPEWTVTWRGLEKLPLLRKVVTSVNASHNFTGKRSVVWTGSPDKPTRENFTVNFSPLIQLTMQFKKGISADFQISRTRSIEANQVVNGATRTTTLDISVSARYSKRSGFRIPIWPFKNMSLKNSVDFSVTFNKNRNVVDISRGASEKWDNRDLNSRWSFIPKMTYSFSNRVRGSMGFEYGQTETKLSGKTTIRALNVDVNISIRGS